MKPAILLIGHGSKARGFDTAMKRIAHGLQKSRKYSKVLCAYLGSASPSIEEALDRLVRASYSEIIALPYFVLNGFHVAKDIPVIIRKARRKYGRKAKIQLGAYLGYDEYLVRLVHKRILEAR